MIKVEKIDVWGWEHAIRGMRNSFESHDKSDTLYCPDIKNCDGCYFRIEDMDCKNLWSAYQPIIGKNDLILMQKLYKAGTSHRKFLRQLFVSMDITAPLYWWKQMDTYKVGVTMNSTSTMHTIHKKEFTLDDFSHDYLDKIKDEHRIKLPSYPEENAAFFGTPTTVLRFNIDILNYYRKCYLTYKEKEWWDVLIQSLPSTYNQLRTVTMNYENVVNIINQRRGHRLDEWNTFCDILRDLPYVKEVMNE